MDDIFDYVETTTPVIDKLVPDHLRETPNVSTQYHNDPIKFDDIINNESTATTTTTDSTDSAQTRRQPNGEMMIYSNGRDMNQTRAIIEQQRPTLQVLNAFGAMMSASDAHNDQFCDLQMKAEMERDNSMYISAVEATLKQLSPEFQTAFRAKIDMEVKAKQRETKVMELQKIIKAFKQEIYAFRNSVDCIVDSGSIDPKTIRGIFESCGIETDEQVYEHDLV